MNIYYFHPLNLSFTSAQTLQIIKDYFYLSKHNHKIFLYGTFSKIEELEEILSFVRNSNISLIFKKHTFFNRNLLKFIFLFNIFKDKNQKILVTRSVKKVAEILFYKVFFNNFKIIHELHEEAFPHLIKKKQNRQKQNFINIIQKVDGVIFTNFSQEILFQKEFNFTLKASIVLPNGVEIRKFSKTIRNSCSKSIFLTYLGQFNSWKNIELIFAAFSLIKKDNFYLKIAGGKNDKASKDLIISYIKKYNINPQKVIYLGFVRNDEIVEKVLNHSNILLLPLGDNYQSRYLTSPMKLFEYMATTIPVLSIDFPSINLIVKNKEIFLSKCDANDFYTKIMQITQIKNIDDNIDAMNALAKKYSYEQRSIDYDLFLKKV